MLARRLFYFYPLQDVGNAQVVLAGIIELFEAYPPDVVDAAVSVTRGIPSKFKFIPRISEIKEFLDGLMPKGTPPRAYPVFERLPAPDRSKRLSYEELQARCHAAGLYIGQRGRQQARAEDTAAFRDKWGISNEAWNAIPDRGST